MPTFIESDLCKTHQNCFVCRREPKFREQMKKQFKGDWECPLGIPIGATDEQFPPEILEKHLEQKKVAEERQKMHQEAIVAFEELEMTLTGDNLQRLERIRTVFLPQSKLAEKCRFSQKQIGSVESKCCGGKIKQVLVYECSKHIICIDKKCHHCSDFLLKENYEKTNS